MFSSARMPAVSVYPTATRSASGGRRGGRADLQARHSRAVVGGRGGLATGAVTRAAGCGNARPGRGWQWSRTGRAETRDRGVDSSHARRHRARRRRGLSRLRHDAGGAGRAPVDREHPRHDQAAPGRHGPGQRRGHARGGGQDAERRIPPLCGACRLHRLRGCRHMVAALGTAPARFRRVGLELDRACADLQRSSELFTKAVAGHDARVLASAARLASRAAEPLLRGELGLGRPASRTDSDGDLRQARRLHQPGRSVRCGSCMRSTAASSAGAGISRRRSTCTSLIRRWSRSRSAGGARLRRPTAGRPGPRTTNWSVASKTPAGRARPTAWTGSRRPSRASSRLPKRSFSSGSPRSCRRSRRRCGL